ncbi:MAG: hypothetical protein JSW27_04130 [Phycisphaerales bacterium]|nr:MAG: hypothetical protein JSW27_04130 [Phycisphaerales bacterium]
MVARWRHLLFACGLSSWCAVSVLSPSASAQQPLRRASAVPEIRFGAIEPPVVAQRDITIRAAVSNQQPEKKALECSGMAWIGEYLLLSSDRHGHVLFTCPIDLQHMATGMPTAHVVIENEQELLDDAECLVVHRNAGGEEVVFALCSLSNDPDELPLPKRRHMLRLILRDSARFTIAHRRVLNVGALRDLINGYFEAARIAPYRTFNAGFVGADKNTYRWGNVEGMCFAPDGRRLLLGLRNPLLAGRALVAVVEEVERAFTMGDPDRLRLSDLFDVNLGERGISDLCWDPLTQGYLITAAKSNGPKLDKNQAFPPNTLDSALFWWTGHKQDEPVLCATFPDMKVEAVCRLGSTRYIAVGSDEGDVSEGRPQQKQSVVTILYFTGIETGTTDGTRQR